MDQNIYMSIRQGIFIMKSYIYIICLFFTSCNIKNSERSEKNHIFKSNFIGSSELHVLSEIKKLDALENSTQICNCKKDNHSNLCNNENENENKNDCYLLCCKD